MPNDECPKLFGYSSFVIRHSSLVIENMGRHLDPVCRLCRREGIKLFLKGARCASPKCAIERRNVAPGMHSYRRGKPTEHGLRLPEKQKLNRFYGLFEPQFRRYFDLASRSEQHT